MLDLDVEASLKAQGEVYLVRLRWKACAMAADTFERSHDG